MVTTSAIFWSLWDWEPSVVIGCVAILSLYLVFVRARSAKRILCFLAGDTILFLALVSPLDGLGDTYLFSAHMLQHLLLVLAVPPLLIWGIPEEAWRTLLRWRVAAQAEAMLRQPLLAWGLAIGILLAWHVPALYNAALANEDIHVVQHLCFLVTATVFWWPVVSPLKRLRYSAPFAVAYLASAMLANLLLGIIITFSPAGLYPAYLHPSGDPAIMALIRQDWGVSAALDHQLGGLLMWVPGCAVYLVFVLAEVVRALSGACALNNSDSYLLASHPLAAGEVHDGR